MSSESGPQVVPDGILRSAFPEGKGEYRYWLKIEWDTNAPTLVACMLNPSHASDVTRDRTTDRLTNFAVRWGFGAVHVVNLFAWRSADPKKMFAQPERIGPENDRHLREAIQIAQSNGGKFLVAWGNDGNYRDGRAAYLLSMIAGAGQMDLLCLGRTASGQPKHPLARGKAWIPDDFPAAPFC